MEMKKCLEKISKVVVKMAEKTNQPAGIYFNSTGKLWYKNKHWSFDALAKELELSN